MSEDSVKIHECTSALKELAVELGRTPLRNEFRERVPNSSRILSDYFKGSYSILVQAAGLEPSYATRRSKAEKISSDIFVKNLYQHLEGRPDQSLIERKPYPKLATISDIHWPFCKQPVVDRFIEYVGDVKPDWVVLNGDAWDMYSHTKFPRSHNVFTPREERELSLKANAEFWGKIQARVPNAQLVQMLGNHDVRPLKRMLEAYPAAEDWIEQALQKDFTFEGVKTIFDAREELVINNVMIFHGYRSGLGAHRDYTLYNTVNGHTHLGGVTYRRLRGETLWELNSGYAGDPEAKGLTYTAQRTTHWTWGFGAIDELGPRFIPL